MEGKYHVKYHSKCHLAQGIGPRADALSGRTDSCRVDINVSGYTAILNKPANSAVSNLDTENEVLNKYRWEQIHQWRRQGQSVSAIARQLDVDRKTVRSWLKQPDWVPYRRKAKDQTVLSPHQNWLVQRAPQVGYSARILFQELVTQYGYTGSYDTVKIAVRPLRQEADLSSLTQCRFETAPGEQAQVDWGEVKIRFKRGDLQKVHIFVMTLGYSRRTYAEGFEHERLSALLDAHEHAFAWFGGYCAQLLYDRMRTVCSPMQHGPTRWNATFEAFAQHWGFEPRLCRPRRAQTKGKVESGVKYIKRNFVPGRTFDDLDDFNEQLRQWLLEVADQRVHGTTHQRPTDRFVQEAAYLVSTLGQAGFLHAMIRHRVVANDWLISLETNRYSVPCRLIGKTVQVLRQGALWQIYYREKLVAEHPVLAGRYQLSVLPEHSPGAVARNARHRYAHALKPSYPKPNPLQLRVEVRDPHYYEQLTEVVG